MALARAAAARALAAHDQSQTPQDETQPTPKAAPAAKSSAYQPPAPKPADPDLAFARHARSVRQSVELWEKITNNAFARRPAWSEPTCPDLDLEEALEDHEPPPFSQGDAGNLYEAVGNLSLISPAHNAIPESLLETIEQTLTAHPNDHLSINFARICEIFGLTPDRTLLQPHLESQLRPPPDGYPKLE